MNSNGRGIAETDLNLNVFSPPKVLAAKMNMGEESEIKCSISEVKGLVEELVSEQACRQVLMAKSTSY